MDQLFGVTQLFQQKGADPELASTAGDVDKTVSIDDGNKDSGEQRKTGHAHRTTEVQEV